MLRKACEKKNEQISFFLFGYSSFVISPVYIFSGNCTNILVQIEMLRRRLDEEIAQKIQLSAELEETQRVLNECR